MAGGEHHAGEVAHNKPAKSGGKKVAKIFSVEGVSLGMNEMLDKAGLGVVRDSTNVIADLFTGGEGGGEHH